MMKTRTFDLITDPGHGWLKVPKKLLVELGIADKISTCSYMRGDFAYLEEDGDMGLAYKALRERGVEPKLRERPSREKRSRVRHYDYYRSPA